MEQPRGTDVMDYYVLELFVWQLLGNSPAHLSWLLVFIMGVAVASTRSGAAGGALIVAALVHAVQIALTGLQMLMIMQDGVDFVTLSVGFSVALTIMTILKYGLLIGAVWIGRRS
ncbi:MAG: hypothetical protein AAFV53_26005 [Myxococcota bacterium]